jgi:hypothetical protein
VSIKACFFLRYFLRAADPDDCLLIVLLHATHADCCTVPMPPTLIVERALQEGLVGTLVARLQRTVAVADQWSPLWEHATGLLAQLATHAVHNTSASIQDSAAALAQVCWSCGLSHPPHLTSPRWCRGGLRRLQR